jgi:hypothetical protein
VNHQANTDDTNAKKAPWYSDFIEGGELAKNVVRDAYDAVTWKSIGRMTMDRFPFLEWMQTYTLVKFLKDAQAGFVVATLVIPQVRNKSQQGHNDSRREVGKFRRRTDRVSCILAIYLYLAGYELRQYCGPTIRCRTLRRLLATHHIRLRWFFKTDCRRSRGDHFAPRLSVYPVVLEVVRRNKRCQRYGAGEIQEDNKQRLPRHLHSLSLSLSLTHARTHTQNHR